MKMIIPKEKRVTVYSVLDNEIINNKQKAGYQDSFGADAKNIAEERNECIKRMSNTDNLHSFVFVHKNGNVETEINVSHPRYCFHSNYNDPG